MRKILYLIKTSAKVSETLLPSHRAADQETSLILIQDGVTQTNMSGNHVYVLSDDAAARGVTSHYSAISYRDLLQMIFDADAVITV